MQVFYVLVKEQIFHFLGKLFLSRLATIFAISRDLGFTFPVSVSLLLSSSSSWPKCESCMLKSGVKSKLSLMVTIGARRDT